MDYNYLNCLATRIVFQGYTQKNSKQFDHWFLIIRFFGIHQCLNDFNTFFFFFFFTETPHATLITQGRLAVLTERK